jgi:hypothetical protein
MERIVAMKSKKARTALKEGLQAGIKRPAANSPRDSSSEDEDGIVRPCRDMVMPMSKHDFLEKMKLLNHPILQNEEKLEMTYRYIDLANSMLKSPEKKMEEIQTRQDSKDNTSRQDTGKNEETAFFRGDMSTTIMVNGVDQIAMARKAEGWSQALTDVFWEAKVIVKDYWVVKKLEGRVTSVLVQTISRYQKIRAIGAINYARSRVSESLGTKDCRVNVRDAFPREQMAKVKKAYDKGYQLKKEGKIQAYRIYNQGGEEPVFEIRTFREGKAVWESAPPAVETLAVEGMDTTMAEGEMSKRKDSWRPETAMSSGNAEVAMAADTGDGGE